MAKNQGNKQSQNTKKVEQAAKDQNAKTTNATNQDKAPEAEAKAQADQTNTATVRVNGGEPVALNTPEGQAAIRQLIDEAVAKGEKPKVSINDGQEYDYDSPELEAEWNRLTQPPEFGADDSVKAVSEETQKNAKGGDKNQPSAAKIKAAKDSTTASQVVDGEVKTEILPRSPENPNERFTESIGKPRIDQNAGK